MRTAYRGLGVKLNPRYQRNSTEYPELKLAEQLQLDGNLRAVCVVLIDGLGLQQLIECKAHTPFLRTRLKEAIEGRTVLPSTTAAALTSLTTGEYPAYTNMTGWSVKIDKTIGNLINFTDIPIPPQEFQPVEPLFSAGGGATVFTASRFQDSGLTKAAFRGATFVGADSFSERVNAARQHLIHGQGLSYLYCSELDHVGHLHGWRSLNWTDELEQVDAQLRALVAGCPADAAVVLTADHGMIDAEKRWDLGAEKSLSSGVEAIAGEGRCVHLHAEPGQREAVLQRWADFLGETAVIVTEPEIVFGGRVPQHYTADALVFSLGNQVIVDSRTQPAGQVELKGVHGSLTEAETAIPIMRLA